MLALAAALLAVSAPTPLGPVRLARIEAAFANRDHALAAWGVPPGPPACLVIFAERQEWLVDCGELFAGQAPFVATGERRGGQPVLWTDQSFFFDGKHRPYEDVKLQLVAHTLRYSNDKTGQAAQVVVMQDWDALHANHPDFRTDTLEFWLGSFVHESFHVHQGRQPLVRKMKARHDTHAAPSDLERLFTENAGFRAAVTTEYELLRAAAKDAKLDRRRARGALAGWLSLHRARGARFASDVESALPGKHAWEVERFLIAHEGTARYVEASFLNNPGERAVRSLDPAKEPTFENFARTRGKSPADLPGLGTLAKNYYYTLGMYLCLLLDKADPGWKRRLFETEGLLVGLVERVAAR